MDRVASTLRTTWTGLAAALLLACPFVASAAAPTTPSSVFFISRSENRNQVHYGLRLGEGCRPIGASPVYAYWRMLERGESEVEDLLSVEGPVYGVADTQAVESTTEGWRVQFRLRAFADRPIEFSVTAVNGQCAVQAWTNMSGKRAQLEHIFVKTSWPFSIDFVRLDGVGPDGQPMRELIRG
ncbi:DUF4833 domain-containing protein [Myxococcaceae bacterium JPH2]|nr:DUF4833 domain-containing protein [Myxococcaceae bacterium JPH2]